MASISCFHCFVEVEELEVFVLVNSTMLAAGHVCKGSTGWLVGVEARNKVPCTARRGNRQKRSDRLIVVIFWSVADF